MVLNLMAILCNPDTTQRAHLYLEKQKSEIMLQNCFKINFSVEFTGSNINTNISCKLNCIPVIFKV